MKKQKIIKGYKKIINKENNLAITFNKLIKKM